MRAPKRKQGKSRSRVSERRGVWCLKVGVVGKQRQVVKVTASSRKKRGDGDEGGCSATNPRNARPTDRCNPKQPAASDFPAPGATFPPGGRCVCRRERSPRDSGSRRRLGKMGNGMEGRKAWREEGKPARGGEGLKPTE
jgi:hypothetical protein